MTMIDNQNILVYVPRSNVFAAILIGSICLFMGIVSLVLADKQIYAFVFGVLFILGGLWLGSFVTWQMVHRPTLIIDSEGIRSQHSLSRFEVKWSEIDAIYQINYGTAFAIDLSPMGLLSYFSRQGSRIPRHLDPTIPQQAVVVQGVNLALPIDQLLAQIRERFSDQLARYNIDLDDEEKEGQETES